jgi:large subunit ribosomal protein L22
MEAVAHLKYARISPRKVEIVLNLIRKKDAAAAIAILNNTRKAASEYLIKLLKSAMANAENNNSMDTAKLYISECFVTPGPNTMKRSNPRAKGSSDRIIKCISHVTIKLKEKES